MLKIPEGPSIAGRDEASLMAEGYGKKLQDLRLRADVHVRELAAVIPDKDGKPGAAVTTYRNYENSKTYIDSPIPTHIMLSIMPLLVGKGNPQITADECINISEMRGVQRFCMNMQTKASRLAVSEEPNFVHVQFPFLRVRYDLQLGVYISAAAEAVNHAAVSPVLPSGIYPQDRQWAALVKDNHGMSIGLSKGAYVCCVDMHLVSPADAEPGSVVVVRRDRDGARGELWEYRLAIITDNRLREGYGLKAITGEPLSAQAIGLALRSYAPVTQQTV